jgi:hypothetical protein
LEALGNQIDHYLIHLQYLKVNFNGKEVAEHFNLKPGKLIGSIKDSVSDAIMNGDIPNSKPDILCFIQTQFFDNK